MNNLCFIDFNSVVLCRGLQKKTKYYVCFFISCHNTISSSCKINELESTYAYLLTNYHHLKSLFQISLEGLRKQSACCVIHTEKNHAKAPIVFQLFFSHTSSVHLIYLTFSNFRMQDFSPHIHYFFICQF